MTLSALITSDIAAIRTAVSKLETDLLAESTPVPPPPSPDPTPEPTPVPSGLTITKIGAFPTPTLGDALVGLAPRRLNFGKHTTVDYCPLTEKLYLVGGDGVGHHLSATQSGSMDTVATYDPKNHSYAEDFAYAGVMGDPCPRGLDHIAFTWLPWMRQFWLGPGYAWNYGTDKYPWQDIAWTADRWASYDPAVLIFLDWGTRNTALAFAEGRQSAADTKRKKVLWFSGSSLKSHDPATGVTTQQWPTGIVNIPPHNMVENAAWYDEAKDEFYCVQIATGLVYAIHVGNNTIRVLADMKVTLGTSATRACVFLTDVKHLLVCYDAAEAGALPCKLVNLATGAVTGLNLYTPGHTRSDAGGYHVATRTIVLLGGTTDGNLNNGNFFHEFKVNAEAVPVPTPPPPSGLPAWLPPVGQVKAIPTVNTLKSVMYLTSAAPGDSGIGDNYFGNWTSGCYAKSDGLLGSMVFSCGGDRDYGGNEVYKLSLDSLRFSRECERSTGLVATVSGNPVDPNYDYAWGEHVNGALRQPGAPHNYDAVEYLPPECGGGPKGSLVFLTRSFVYKTNGYKHPHVFDLDKKAWRRGSVSPGIVQWDGTMIPDSPCWAYDSKRKKFWGAKNGGQWVNRLVSLTFGADGMATAGASVFPDVLIQSGYPTMRYWPTGDQLVTVGLSQDRTKFQLMTSPVVNPRFLTLLTTTAIPVSNGYGFAYSQRMDKFFVRLSAGSRQLIWKITPGTWTIEQIAMTGDTVMPKGNPNGMWKRLMCIERDFTCLAWMDDISGPVYAYRVA